MSVLCFNFEGKKYISFSLISTFILGALYSFKFLVIKSFNEQKLLKNYKKYNLYDFQGTYWAPHVIHRDTWNRASGLSEEFDPGFGSDPDLNFKLWKLGVRYFKGLNNCKVYHFGSISLRKKRGLVTNKGNRKINNMQN